MGYVFTRRHPPLLKEVEDPRAVDSDLLKFVIGRAVWNTSREVSTSAQVYRWNLYETKFDLERSFRWIIKSGPIHKAEDFTLKITETRGYNITQKKTFENTLEVTTHSDLEIPHIKLSLDVKNTLKITDEVTQDWKIETVTETNETFKADTTYYKWMLVERLHLQKTVVLKYLFGSEKHVVGIEPPVMSEADFDCVLGQYDDKAADSSGVALSKYINLQKALFQGQPNQFSTSDEAYKSVF